MHPCRALATDYDGTIATHGTVDPATIEALRRFKRSGRTLIMVTGRRMEDLASVFPEVADFDVVVAENGALLHWPQDGREILLADRPSPDFLSALAEKGLPLEIGRAIVATIEPHETVVLELIKTFGVELQVIFNKGAVMILPSGINKATGLAAALKHFQIDAADIAGVGDAENDHAFLDLCGISAAVANALPALKQHADIVLAGRHGAGVAELIETILASDPPSQPAGAVAQ